MTWRRDSRLVALGWLLGAGLEVIITSESRTRRISQFTTTEGREKERRESAIKASLGKGSFLVGPHSTAVRPLPSVYASWIATLT